jgi:UMF1 family MFS transporter
MLREVKRLPQTFTFLGTWLLLSDGFTTITSVAVLFAKTELHMPATSLILIGLFSPMAGIGGAFLWPRIASACGMNPTQTLVAVVVCASLVPLYGCLGFLPLAQRIGFGGLTSPAEMYALAIVFGEPTRSSHLASIQARIGIIYAGLQTYSRSVYAGLLPPGQEARFFGLYSITDKCARALASLERATQAGHRSASFIGPLVVGLIADLFGSIRLSFFFLFLVLALPIPVLAFILDADAGRRDAEAYAEGDR